jgi:hypothetical protein
MNHALIAVEKGVTYLRGALRVKLRAELDSAH